MLYKVVGVVTITNGGQQSLIVTWRWWSKSVSCCLVEVVGYKVGPPCQKVNNVATAD